ncbi:MAG: P-II family nitrogen regulator [Candidatus Omnitrophica bacterium]|nr:P-II family nitrogen regulator [Candidatus Omnitrophota bacterium]MBU2251779.1 P-II family nitrogen regulator [Candidatus Omnitrophota bacterium]
MKKIEAIIQPEKLEDVKKELFKAEVHKMTVSRVKGCGQQKGYTESYRGAIFKVNLLPKVKIDIAVNENFVKPTIEAIIKGARTGNIGDGKIFVSDLQECIRISTGEEGNQAIG